MNFSRTLIIEKTTFLRYIIWSTTLPCCLLGVRRGVNVAALPFLWLRNISIQLQFTEPISAILMPFGLIINKCWSYSFAFVQKRHIQWHWWRPYLAKFLNCWSCFSYVFIVHLYPNALSPMATAEPRLIILTDTLIPIHRFIDCDVCGWSTYISVKRFFDMMQ